MLVDQLIVAADKGITRVMMAAEIVSRRFIKRGQA
jgi:hypothetical protein